MQAACMWYTGLGCALILTFTLPLHPDYNLRTLTSSAPALSLTLALALPMHSMASPLSVQSAGRLARPVPNTMNLGRRALALMAIRDANAALQLRTGSASDRRYLWRGICSTVLYLTQQGPLPMPSQE